jgi:O-acetylhomoserine (thiol)-lyase
VKFYETFGDFGFMMRARMETLRVYGAALSPMSAWQILQGVETLPLRMERHCSNALAVAQFLRSHPRVGWVNYPGLPDHPQHALRAWRRHIGGGPAASGLLAFGVKGGLAAACEVHRIGAVHEPPGQHRRHAHADQPPRAPRTASSTRRSNWPPA